MKRLHTGRVWRRLLLLFIVSLLPMLVGCTDFPFPSNSAVLKQGHGLPTLRLLDWGFFAINHPVWSPNGRWIAVLAGEDFAGAHVEVVSPDGKTRYDLSSWGCGEGPDPDYAWLPDGRLSCINREVPYPQLCIGAAPFTSCAATRLDMELSTCQCGFAWTPDTRLVLLSATPNDGSSDNNLYVLTPDGTIRQTLTFPGYYGVVAPFFRPHQTELAYCRGAYVDTGGIVHFDLVISTVSEDAVGQLILGPARTLATEQIPDASGYAWSPSGRWIAVAYSDNVNGDKIALINPDNPAQTIDVVQVNLVDSSMFDPIWSPDGKTLIVFGGYGPKPYAIDIASYLASKGLQP